MSTHFTFTVKGTSYNVTIATVTLFTCKDMFLHKSSTSVP